MDVQAISAVSVAGRLTRGALRTTQNRLQRLPSGAYKRKCEFVSLSYSPVRRQRRRTSTAFSEVGEEGTSRTVVGMKEEEEHEEHVPDVNLEQEPDEKDGFQADTEPKEEKKPVPNGFQDATVEVKEEKPEGPERNGFQESEEVTLEVTLDLQLEASKPDGDSDVCQFKPFPLALSLESESDELGSPSQVPVNGDASSSSPVSAEPIETLKEEDAKGEVLEKDCQEKVVQKALYFGSPGYDAESCFRRKKEYGWVRSDSRFAAFLRSAVGACEVPGVESAIPKAREQSFGDSDHGCGSPVSSSAKKDEPATFPGKRKISLSPCSQLKLVKASKSSSYRRMMPFWNELAKNLDGTVDVKCAQQTLPNSNATEEKISDSMVAFDDKGSVENDKPVVLFNTPASVPFKGILKTSPRACKGLCMCLDCSYFRTHAETSADFSERQLHDVEALVTPLINELGRMRRLLDKSLPNQQGGSEILPHSEVNEASRRALKVERAATTRLKKLSRDYNIQCKIMRTQRRQVKFADKIDVRLFSD